MKSQQFHKVTAILLAVLVFFSTTGVGIALGWCHCTDKAVASIFIPLECCQHQAIQQAKDACCSKTTVAINHGKTSVSAQKCCDTVYKYTTADINFTSWVDVEFPSINWVTGAVALVDSYKTTWAHSWVPKSLVGKANANKAPPKLFGKKLLQFIQIYRC
jgi:hypothetical protein